MPAHCTQLSAIHRGSLIDPPTFRPQRIAGYPDAFVAYGQQVGELLAGLFWHRKLLVRIRLATFRAAGADANLRLTGILGHSLRSNRNFASDGSGPI
jgi:hypothetical protein